MKSDEFTVDCRSPPDSQPGQWTPSFTPYYGHHWGNPTVLTAWFINVYHPTGLPKRFTALLVSPDGVSIRFYVVRFVECQMRWTTPRPSFCSMPDANRWKHVQFLSISIT